MAPRTLRAAGLVAGAVLVAAAAGPVAGQLAAPVERWSVDARFGLRGDRVPDPRIVIVALDDGSLQELQARPPIARGLQARLVDRLGSDGAAVIAYDFSLEQPSSSADRDVALATSLLNARRATVSVASPDPDGAVEPLAGRLPFQPPWTVPGWTALRPDADGVVRRFTEPRGSVQPFALAAARQLTGRRLAPPPRALVDYPGPGGTFPRVGYAAVLDGRVPAQALRGKLVIVGPTATVLGDKHPIPGDRTVAGPELHAAAAATALAGFPLRAMAPGGRSAIDAGLGLAVALLTLGGSALGRRRRTAHDRLARLGAPDPRLAVAAGAVVLAGWLVAAQVAFSGGTVVAVVEGAGAILAAAAWSRWSAARATRREQAAVRARFAAGDRRTITDVLAAERQRRVLGAGDIVPGFDVESEVARGGMGVVYRARQLRLERPVALKLILPDRAGDPVHRRRFVEEAHRAAAVSHPHVMPILDAGDADGILYLAMPFVAGRTLAAVVARSGALPSAYALEVLTRVADALDAAHDEAGLLHRDVKPANILLPERTPRSPYLLDFGLAARADDGDALRGSTPAYRAPERRGGSGGRPADVFALAATLFEALTGAHAQPLLTDGADRSALATALRELRPDLPADLGAVLARGLADDPAGRFTTAGALMAAATTAIGLEPGDAAAPSDDLPPAAPPGAARARPRPADDATATEIEPA